MWCNFKFEGALFRSDSRHNDRVDSLWECATKQAVMTVAPQIAHYVFTTLQFGCCLVRSLSYVNITLPQRILDT